jgi:streptogramin lyase
VWALLGLVVAQLLVAAGAAEGHVALSAKLAPKPGAAVLDVTMRADARRVTVERADLKLAAAGDMFGVRSWSARGSRLTLAARGSRSFGVTFGAPRAALKHAALSYRSEVVPLHPRGVSAHLADQQTAINSVPVTGGVGQPWGTAADGSGRIWFAEAGCDFAPTCPATTPPGQIGVLDPGSGAVNLYTLPNIQGNQPIFVAFDGAGNLWFTTPNNSMIGEFDPATGRFIGQWQVTSGSGPWNLTFANDQIWYTEHLVSAVGRFDPVTHTHQDFQTPSANSNPYGIAASGGRIWFTENNSSVDQVALLDTGQGNAITEYPIVHPFNGTPHQIVVDPSGQPWWTEGWSGTIATLNPAVATPGNCPPSGTCSGIQQFQLPPSSTCGGGTHASGIAFDVAANRLWIDNSLTAQVGSFTPATRAFDLNTLSSCGVHPHDGISLDAAGNVWFDEEFANALGEVVVPRSAPPAAAGSGGPAAAQTVNAGAPPANREAPTIRGSRREAHTLTAQNGSWANSPTDFSYTWQRCTRRCTNIAATMSGSYRLARRDIDAKVRVVVVARNAAGSARAPSRSVGPIAPSLKRVNEALARLLSVSTNGGTIAKLRRDRASTASFLAPSGGKLRVFWYARHVLLAATQRRFAKAHGARLTIQLTGAGARLLSRAHKLTVGVKAVFTPLAGAGVVGRKRVTLSAR